MSKLATISMTELETVTGGDGLDYIDCMTDAVDKARAKVALYSYQNPGTSWRSDKRAVQTFANGLNREASFCRWTEQPLIPQGPRTDL